MTQRNLEIFVAVAERGKMSDAARSMYITQSSVSQAIAEIEKKYGVLLFERLSKSLYLTETGERFLEYARQALSLNLKIEEFLHSASSNRNIRVGATVTVGTCAMSPIISQLEQRFSGLRAEVCVANTHLLEEMMLRNELDISLVEGRITHPDLLVEKAMDDRLVVICPPDHPFYGRTAISIQDLAGQPMILREQGSGTRAQLENCMAELHLPLNVLWNCYNTEAIINAVADGHGLSVISERLVAGHENLWCARICDVDFDRSFDLVWHKDKFLTDVLRGFMEICHAFGAEHPPACLRFVPRIAPPPSHMVCRNPHIDKIFPMKVISLFRVHKYVL